MLLGGNLAFGRRINDILLKDERFFVNEWMPVGRYGGVSRSCNAGYGELRQIIFGTAGSNSGGVQAKDGTDEKQGIVEINPRQSEDFICEVIERAGLLGVQVDVLRPV
jgi:hypothetical protein